MTVDALEIDPAVVTAGPSCMDSEVEGFTSATVNVQVGNTRQYEGGTQGS